MSAHCFPRKWTTATQMRAKYAGVHTSTTETCMHMRGYTQAKPLTTVVVKGSDASVPSSGTGKT